MFSIKDAVAVAVGSSGIEIFLMKVMWATTSVRGNNEQEASDSRSGAIREVAWPLTREVMSWEASHGLPNGKHAGSTVGSPFSTTGKPVFNAIALWDKGSSNEPSYEICRYLHREYNKEIVNERIWYLLMVTESDGLPRFQYS
jgi:hypothetical protein